eukprot:255395_1
MMANKSQSLIDCTELEIKNEDTKLEIKNDTAEHDANPLSQYFSDTFTWLEPIVYYSPIWIKQKSNTETTKTNLNYFVLSLNVGFVLLYCGLQYFFQITGWYMYADINNIIWCCYIVCLCSSRLLSIIYCYKYFNWPWKREFLPFQHQQKTDSNNKYQKLIIRCKILFISTTVSYIVLDIIVIILVASALLPYYHGTMLTYIVVKSLCRLFLLYPQLATTMIQSIILLKYCLCLHQLYDKMNSDMSNVDLRDIFEQYNNLYKSFKRDYHKTLIYSIRLYLAAEILLFWDSLNYMGMFVMFVILVRELSIFLLYFDAASILEKIHRKFSKKLWKNAHIFLNNKEKSHNANYYNSILLYIQRYPFYLKFGSVIVSQKNVIKYSMYLLATRALAYAIRHWIEVKY